MELPKLLFMWREQYMSGGVGMFFFFQESVCKYIWGSILVSVTDLTFWSSRKCIWILIIMELLPSAIKHHVNGYAL